MQRTQEEGRVADPAVAVVPVPLAAGRLRQRRGERRDRRTRRHVREALDRERRPLDHRPELVVGNRRAGEPVAPEARRRRELIGGLVAADRDKRFVAPGQCAIDGLAGAQHVAGPSPAGLDAQRAFRSGAVVPARRPWRRLDADPGSASTRRDGGHSRTRARTRGRSRHCRRCSGRSARAHGSHPRPMAVGCGV